MTTRPKKRPFRSGHCGTGNPPEIHRQCAGEYYAHVCSCSCHDQPTTMRFAYADPPYLGCGKLYPEHPDALTWDDPETHRQLIGRLSTEYPDGWALSLSSPSLRTILPMCPTDVRVAAWVKPFAAFKRNVRNAYTWEPVVLRGGRMSSKDGAPVTRDHLAEPITLRRGLTGAKPDRFCRWVLDMLGYVDGDTVDDLFPGTEAMGRVLAQATMELHA